MSPVRVQIVDDGPLAVIGEVEIVDAEGRAFTPPSEPFALCRCGNSNNKPFCDGSHARVGFQASDRAPDEGS